GEQKYNPRPCLDDFPPARDGISQSQHALYCAMELYYRMCQPEGSAATRSNPDRAPRKEDEAEQPES
ncbi:hypothetical protein FRC10_004335, partial [Ceratobasidium sp. 414]